jgi:hypothetical protein
MNNPGSRGLRTYEPDSYWQLAGPLSTPHSIPSNGQKAFYFRCLSQRNYRVFIHFE